MCSGTQEAVSDTAHEAVSAAVDTAHIALNSMKSKKEEWKEEHEKEDEPKRYTWKRTASWMTIM